MTSRAWKEAQKHFTDEDVANVLGHAELPDVSKSVQAAYTKARTLLLEYLVLAFMAKELASETTVSLGELAQHGRELFFREREKRAFSQR